MTTRLDSLLKDFPQNAKLHISPKAIKWAGRWGGNMNLSEENSVARYHIPKSQHVRKIERSFAWIDHRLVRYGYLSVMTHQDLALYVFLVLVADRNGVSFYRKEKICSNVGMDFAQFEIARDRLVSLKLIAFEPYSVLSPNGYYQVLPIEKQAPDFAAELIQKVGVPLQSISAEIDKPKTPGNEQRSPRRGSSLIRKSAAPALDRGRV